MVNYAFGYVSVSSEKANASISPSHPVTNIELDISGGSVEIKLPDGASASTDGIEAIRRSIEDHRYDPRQRNV